MFARLATRAPVVARQTVRFNSSSSTSGAARVIQMAAQAERPSKLPLYYMLQDSIANNHCVGAMEAGVPVMWAVCGALTYTAWNRMDASNASGNVEKLIIV
jgi:hypothetical protein